MNGPGLEPEGGAASTHRLLLRRIFLCHLRDVAALTRFRHLDLQTTIAGDQVNTEE